MAWLDARLSGPTNRQFRFYPVRTGVIRCYPVRPGSVLKAVARPLENEDGAAGVTVVSDQKLEVQFTAVNCI
jgi:hypothetical protein